MFHNLSKACMIALGLFALDARAADFDQWLEEELAQPEFSAELDAVRPVLAVYPFLIRGFASTRECDQVAKGYDLPVYVGHRTERLKLRCLSARVFNTTYKDYREHFHLKAALVAEFLLVRDYETTRRASFSIEKNGCGSLGQRFDNAIPLAEFPDKVVFLSSFSNPDHGPGKDNCIYRITRSR